MWSKKPCKICHRKFRVDKFHPYQKVCSRNECKREHKKRLLTKWREANPGYGKNWKRDTRESAKRWRKKNPDYYRTYRKEHPEVKEKTRGYVKAYREREQGKETYSKKF